MQVTEYCAPVPGYSVQKILISQYIDLKLLLPVNLANLPASEESFEKKLAKVDLVDITDYASWAEAFYSEVIASKFPQRMQDLMGYNLLMTKATREVEGNR